MTEVIGVRQRLQQAGLVKRRFPIEVYQDAQDLFNRDPQPGWTAMESELADKHPDEFPTEKTIRDWEKRGVITKEEEDAPWVFGEGARSDDAIVLSWAHRSLGELTALVLDGGASSEGLHWAEGIGPTRRFARWLVRLRCAVPDLNPDNPEHAQVLSSCAHYASHGGESLQVAQWGLMLAPWRDGAVLLRRWLSMGVDLDYAFKVVSWCALYQWLTADEMNDLAKHRTPSRTP